MDKSVVSREGGLAVWVGVMPEVVATNLPRRQEVRRCKEA